MSYKQVHKKILNALKKEDLRKGSEAATKDELKKRRYAIATHKYSMDWAKDVKNAKTTMLYDVNSSVEKFRKAFEGENKHFYFARTPQDLKNIIAEIIKPGSTVVKSKSMVGEEIELRQFMESHGIKIYETDLGEFLIQLANEKPAHMVTPAVNMSEERARKLLEPVVREKLNDVNSMVLGVRKFMRKIFFSAEFGMVGANALSADTGSIIFIENEGNGALTSTLPDKLIVITSVEKIYPTLLDAIKAVTTQAIFSGFEYTTYVHIINGPYDFYGPKEIHLILLDNGRIRSDDLKETLFCIKCGACQFACPVFQVVDGAWGYIYTAAIGIPWTAITNSKETARALAAFCLECGKCKEVCPMNIDIPELIRKIKAKEV
jgi:L-lactate dehydrogenase complex protein LldG